MPPESSTDSPPPFTTQYLGPGWSRWPAPAKLNLFLRVTGRLADGYHALQTVFRLLEWGDLIRLRPRPDGVIRRLGAAVPGVAAEADLAVRAACLLQTAANSGQGADIIVEKHIPVGAGLGGGSSNAATVLCALNRLWRANLSTDQLAELGQRLGADVPVFVRGHNAWAEGTGERLTPIDLPIAWYLLVHPGVAVATASLFQAADLTRDCQPVTIASFVADTFRQGAMLGNVFESVLRRREPTVEAAFTALAGVGTPRLTGTGSSVFVEFAAREPAERALAALPPGLRARLVRGAQRSQLLDALEAGADGIGSNNRMRG